MSGYNPRCDKCHKCPKCQGEGAVREPVSRATRDGGTVQDYKRVKCTKCRGVGGQRSPGRHDHD